MSGIRFAFYILCSFHSCNKAFKRLNMQVKPFRYECCEHFGQCLWLSQEPWCFHHGCFKLGQFVTYLYIFFCLSVSMCVLNTMHQISNIYPDAVWPVPGKILHLKQKVADDRKDTLLHRSHRMKKGGAEWKWAVALQKNCCITKEPVLGRKGQSRMAGFLSKRLNVARTIEECRWIRSTMSESYLISFRLQFVNSH